MKIKKPKFWDKKQPNLIAILLYPISLIYRFLNNLNKKKIKKKEQLNIKTICVGNIYLGGTGKTSLSIHIKNLIEKLGKKVCFIKKKNNKFSDELNLLNNHGKTFNEKSRQESLLKAEQEKFDYAIFDDGLHDKEIFYDLKIVCFNKKNWIGNGFLIPAGPLREEIEEIKKYQIAVLIGNDEPSVEKINFLKNINFNLLCFNAEYKLSNINQIDLNNNYLVFSGIGNHGSFVDMLKRYKIQIFKDIEYPDHYKYKENEIKNLIKLADDKNLKLLTTEKDIIRIETPYKEKIDYVNVSLNLKEELELINKIKII
tara:strand:- start:3217 stop:4155 length:939 start_codon:yes stop_codon:yes gene_type:complete